MQPGNGRGIVSVRGCRLVRRPLVAALLHVHVDEFVGADAGLQEAPALHPLVGAQHLILRDGRRIDEVQAARAQVIDRELIDLRIEIPIVVDEVVHVGLLVRIDATHRLAHRAVEGRIGLRIDAVGRNFGAMVEVLPGKEGLVHISELADYRVGKVVDVVKIGDEVTVKVINIDNLGRVNLSRRAVFAKEEDSPSADYPFRRSGGTSSSGFRGKPRYSGGERPYRTGGGSPRPPAKHN